MNVTPYSFLTALVVSGIFSLLLFLLSFQTTWIMKLGLWPLCVLLLLAGLRMWLPVEMPFTRPVELELEKGSAWLSRPLWGELSLGEGLALLWLLGALFCWAACLQDSDGIKNRWRHGRKRRKK